MSTRAGGGRSCWTSGGDRARQKSVNAPPKSKRRLRSIRSWEASLILRRDGRKFDSADHRDDMKPRWQRGRMYVARRIGSGLGKPGPDFLWGFRPGARRGSVVAGLQEM